jgi:CubicO group peptidase (beta-lactamase class C family)
MIEGASKRPLDALTRDWLTGPLGMSDTSWMKPPESMADVGNPTGLVTTPCDIAKLGPLVLAAGKAASGSYGRLWWLNGGAWSVAATQAARRTEGQRIAAAPADLVAALGAQDRKL